MRSQCGLACPASIAAALDDATLPSRRRWSFEGGNQNETVGIPAAHEGYAFNTGRYLSKCGLISQCTAKTNTPSSLHLLTTARIFFRSLSPRRLARQPCFQLLHPARQHRTDTRACRQRLGWKQTKQRVWPGGGDTAPTRQLRLKPDYSVPVESRCLEHWKCTVSGI